MNGLGDLYIYNTFSGQKEKFVPLFPGKVGMYVCGVTVYDRCHLGHARAVVVFDVIFRYLMALGYDVTYVRNFTDVDDKIINRANELGINWKELAEKFIAKFNEDFSRLNVLKPTVEPKATEHINEIIQGVKELIDKGYAYEKDGDVFYRVRKFGNYGKLSGRSVDELRSGARIEVNVCKDDPLDFALWKKSKENEPAWNSPWGPGRPGWHIECSVMSQKYLGEHFDIHGGGQDLIFPHHENEIAQSEAISGKKFARYWIHNGFVTINKEKMSKSTGNFFALEDIYKQCDPKVLRFFLISRHYKVPLDYSLDLLEESRQALERIENSVGLVENFLCRRSVKIDEDDDKIEMEKFYQAMNDDFNTSQAVAVLFELVTAMNQKLVDNKIDIDLAKKCNAVKKICDILGIELKPSMYNFVSIDDVSLIKEGDNDYKVPETFLDSPLQSGNSVSADETRKLIFKRLYYRKNKDFAKADQIRDKLLLNGYVLRDTKEGTIFFKI